MQAFYLLWQRYGGYDVPKLIFCSDGSLYIVYYQHVLMGGFAWYNYVKWAVSYL